MNNELKNNQKEFYDYIDTSIIKNKKISHAYFIESNFYKKSEEVIMDFVKTILCLSLTKAEKQKTIDLIDSNNYCDLKIIKPNGINIKKEQLKLLEKEFITKPMNDYRIYIVFDADKLNDASSNVILKFLEEPEPGIIGIFVANNRYQVIDTILSRCQILSLVNNEENLEVNNIALEFLKVIEEKKDKAIAYYNLIINTKKETKENILNIFVDINQYFEEILNIKCINSYKRNFNEKLLVDIAMNNSIEQLVKKQQIVYEQINRFKANANTNLILNNFIIKYSEC